MYVVSAEIAKAKKPFSDGEVVKKCCVKMAQAFGEEKLSNNLKNVSLSKQTVTRRVEDISNHVLNKLNSIISEAAYFFLALDKS